MSDTRPQSTRRDFLKTSSVAVGAGLLASASLSAGAYAAGDDTIRIGTIGCGGRGTRATNEALSTKGNVKLIAMADMFEDHLNTKLTFLERKFSEKPGRVDVPKENRFIGFDAYKKLIALKEIDLVIMATPPGFRPIHFEAAVKAGKHIFSEKPVASDAPGVRRFLAAVDEAKKKNLKVGIGLQRHHQNHYLAALKRLKDGVIGDIVSLRVYWNSFGVWDPRKTRKECRNEMEYQLRNWYYYTWLCGDHIVEQHIHNLDVGNWWMSETNGKPTYPVKAYGMGGREYRTDKKYGQIYDHFAVEYEYADGRRMFSQCRHIPSTWSTVSEHAHGTKGVLHTDHRQASIEARDNEWREKNSNYPYQTEHDDLFAAIRAGKPYNEGENGAWSTMTAILGRMATYSGKAITMEKAMASGRNLMPEKYAMDADPPVMPDKDGRYPVPVPGVTNVFERRA